MNSMNTALGELKKILIILRNYVFPACIVCGFVVAVLSLPSEKIARVDYVNFLTGSAILKNDRTNLYNLDVQQATQQGIISDYYKTNYPLAFMSVPLVGLIYLPFSLFSFSVGYQLAALAVIILLLVFSLSCYPVFFRKIKFYQIIFFVFSFVPVIYAIFNAQLPPVLLAFILIGAYSALKNKSPVKLGLFAGLIFVKPQYVTIVPFLFLLAGDRKKFIKGFLISTTFSILINSFIFNNFISEFPKFILSTNKPLYTVNSDLMFSFHAFVGRMITRSAQLWLGDIVLYFIVLAVFILLYKKVNKDVAFAGAVILAIPLSVHVYVQDLVIMLVSAFVLLRSALETNSKIIKKYLILIIFLIYVFPYIQFIKNHTWASLLLICLGFFMLGSKNISGYKESA